MNEEAFSAVESINSAIAQHVLHVDAPGPFDSDTYSMLSLTFEGNGDWAGVLFLGQVLWDTEDGDLREWDEVKGCKVPALEPYLKDRMASILRKMQPMREWLAVDHLERAEAAAVAGTVAP